MTVRLWNLLTPRVDELVVSLLLPAIVVEEKVVVERCIGVCHFGDGLRLQLFLRYHIG